MSKTNVNVIFHGLFLFVKRKDSVHVLLPKIPHHVYLAGSFLAEQTLAPMPFATPYYLTGVTPVGDAFLRPEHNNIVFANQDYDTNLGSDKVHARIVLPKPISVMSMRPMAAPFETDVDSRKLLKGKKQSACQVFQYRAKDPSLSQIRFKPHSAKALAAHEVNKAGFVNLHIFSEQDKPVDVNHPTDDVSYLLDLLPGLRTRIHVTSTAGLDSEDDDKNESLNKKGMFNIETMTLLERQGFLRDAGIAWRQAQKFPIAATIPVGIGSTGCGSFGSNSGDGGN